LPVRRITLLQLLARRDPPVDDALSALAEGRVTVEGAVVTNPASAVRLDARVVVAAPKRPRGVDKLGHVLDKLDIRPEGRTALDVGACTGGFTLALLERGAMRVFSVDVGYGQLLGSLRQDPRVVNLERTNVADLDARLIDRPVDLVVIDVTYVRLGLVISELSGRLEFPPGAVLVGLVKPMFELERGEVPRAPEELAEAGRRAAADAEAAGWTVVDLVESEVRGAQGAVELFLHCRQGPRIGGPQSGVPTWRPKHE
jgi:23S rRNA (cytidine1920-2'-O)/16S rRNA (cytidine1409-2'-O)-methyltransferase